VNHGPTGETAPRNTNPRGNVIGSVMGFQMDGDVFIPNNCNFLFDVSAPNAAGFLVTCLTRNGQELFPGGPVIEFVGLQNFQISEFNVAVGSVTGDLATAELTISGQAGDVFFLGASIGVFAHLGGFADSSNTLLIDIDRPALVQPTFGQQTFVPAPARDVGIDIKPSSDPNCFNINGHGVIPVAILGSDVFDVLDIDQGSLMFGAMGVEIRGQSRPMCHAEYSNGDEFLDLVCQFEDDAASWSPDSDKEASVVGRLIDGRPITGTDSICVVP
jgi:hypothetical protein